MAWLALVSTPDSTVHSLAAIVAYGKDMARAPNLLDYLEALMDAFP
jgi:hypothetical protein